MSVTYSTLKNCNVEFNGYTYATELTDDWKPINLNVAKEGDCDSYATAKQWRLVKKDGLPETATRLACCFVEPFRKADGNWATKGERYHLVLLVDFNGTTYVLDNRYPLPMEYDLLPYEWHKFWNHDMNAWEWAQGADKTIS